MNTVAPKIILDRSIFHGDKYDVLYKSNVKNACNEHKIIIYGNPILYEETMNLWFKGRREEMAKNMKYIIKIANGKWLRTRQEILTNELNHINDDTAYFYSTKEIYKMKQAIKRRLIKQKMENELEETIKKSIDHMYLMKKEHRNGRKMERIDYFKRKKNAGNRKQSSNEGTFDNLYNNVIDDEGEYFIKHIFPSGSATLISDWKANKQKYPYFTFWIKGFVFTRYHNLTEPNAKIDLNAETDMAQLGYMQWADIIVSDDKKFQKDAFMCFYGDEKKYLSLEEFIEYIKKV